MKRMTALAALATALLTSGCGGGDEKEKYPEAPKKAPMELAPSPPISSSDIDAIVKAQGDAPAAPPATTGNTSGPQGN